MSNYISIGPLHIRIRSKHIAPWGFPRVMVNGFSVWSWTNSGELCLASYHPRSSITWLWAFYVGWSWRVWGLSGRHIRRPSVKELHIGPAVMRIEVQDRMPRRAKP
jgi:hypothetical protein